MAKFTIYKGKSALRFSQNPGRQKAGLVTLVEAAPSVAERKYDWENKLVFSLSLTEMAQILLHFDGRAEARFVHDPGIGTDNAKQKIKTLSFTAPDDKSKGTVAFVRLETKEGQNTESISTPLSAAEVEVIAQFLENAIKCALGFGEADLIKEPADDKIL